MKTMVKVQCQCKDGDAAKFQDEKYGKQIRQATVSKKGDGVTHDVRCTVCGTVHRAKVN